MKGKRRVLITMTVMFCLAGLMGCQSADRAETETITSGIISDTDMAPETLAVETATEIIEISGVDQKTAEEKKSESFTVTYEDAQMEILFADCALEYDSEDLKIYVKDIDTDDIEYIDHKRTFPFCGTVVFMQTKENSMQILGMQDYYVDQKNGEIYILSRDERGDSFVSMYRYSLSKTSDDVSISGTKIISTYLVEDWLSDTCQLTRESGKEMFSDLWVILTAVDYDEQGNVILQGEASGIYAADGEKYHVDWEINGNGEDKAVPHEEKIYEKEKAPEIFAACEEAFDLIEQCDKSVLTLTSGQVEYFTKTGEQRRKEEETRGWQRMDVNGDGLPELIALEEGRDKRLIDWIFAYTGGMTKTVEAVYCDLNDYTEYIFVGSNGNLVYDYSDHGVLDFGSYSQYRFDEKWKKELIGKLEIYYFYEDEFYEPDEEEIYKKSYPDTYGKGGSGYYFFRTRLKAGVTPENATEEDWVREEITREEFVEAYREMTGFEFFEINTDFLHEYN